MWDSEFDSNDFPLAYLITVRTYGTWLHGDERLSVDRHGLNVHGRRRRAPNAKLESIMRQNMERDPIVLNEKQRDAVKDAIKDVCKHRSYDLRAVKVLTNHFHVVVAQLRPEPIADAFKSYSTRRLRETGLIGDQMRPWARGRSRRYLWKPKHVLRAIEYVLYGQGDLPNFDD